ncbi:MAG: DUF192 domain-containing protein [Negativicutes bacterium]|nr:DUF192 domain-containing protein [Negativicutes bacterium]
MRYVTIINRDQDLILANYVQLAETVPERLQGLLGTDFLPKGYGLLLRPCYGIHTYGMRYAIDVIFIDDVFDVIKIVAALPPQHTARCSGSAMVLELPAGTAQATGTRVGHRLQEVK